MGKQGGSPDPPGKESSCLLPSNDKTSVQRVRQANRGTFEIQTNEVMEENSEANLPQFEKRTTMATTGKETSAPSSSTQNPDR